MSEWKEDYLGSVLEIKYGKDHKILEKGKIPCYGSGGIMRYVNKALYDKASILIPRKGSLNNIYYVNDKFWTVDTLFWSIIDEEQACPKYLYYQLSKIDFTILNVGSAVPSLTVPVLNEIEIILPPLPEQKAIAEVLSSLEDKIDLLHRQNQTLEAMAETLFRQWFIEERDYTNKVSDLIGLQNGYAFKSKDFLEDGINRVIKIKNISGGIVDIYNSDFLLDDVAKQVDSKFNISSGDILFAMTGAEIGKMGIVPKTTQKLLLNQRVGLFKEKFKGARYLAYLQLKSEYGQDYIENTATGSAQPNISTSGIENCGFPKIDRNKIILVCWLNT